MAAEKMVEMDEDFPQYEQIDQEEAQALEVIHTEDAERHLRAIRHWRAEREAIVSHAEGEMQRIQSWMESETAKIDRRIEWHEGGLVAYLMASGKKTVKLVYGTLKRIAGRERVEFWDELYFLAWANQDPSRQKFVRVKCEPDKRAILDHIKKTGEIPEYCKLVTGEDTYKVEA